MPTLFTVNPTVQVKLSIVRKEETEGELQKYCKVRKINISEKYINPQPGLGETL